MTKQVWPSLQPPESPRKGHTHTTHTTHTTRNTWLIIVGIVGGGLLLAAVLQARLGPPSLSPTSPPPSVTVQLSPKETAPVSTPLSTPPLTANGVPVPFGWYSGSGTVTVKTAEWSAVKLSEYGRAPKNAYLILDVAITGVSGQVSSNPFYWSARDAAGRTYDSTFMGQEPQLHTAELVAGDTSSGYVTIDVPRGPVTVLFTGPSGDTLARWAVPGA